MWEYEKKRNRWVTVSIELVDKLERFYSKFEDGEKLKFPVMVEKDIGVTVATAIALRYCHTICVG